MKTKKSSEPIIIVMKVIMLALTAVFPLLMVTMTGAGLIYNRDSYGPVITRMGVLFIVSAVLMTAGAVFCISRKSLPNLLSAACTAVGIIMCMVLLYKLVRHADSAGWSDNYNMTPVSSMYKARVTPSLLPAAMALVISAVQFFSYNTSEERREKKRKKLERENAPSPKILDE